MLDWKIFLAWINSTRLKLHYLAAPGIKEWGFFLGGRVRVDKTLWAEHAEMAFISTVKTTVVDGG
jgi:hypothetical protein